MDKGKRPMTAAQAQADERAKKTAIRSGNTASQLISLARPHDRDPVYQGAPPLTSMPPFPVEPQNVANIVGTQLQVVAEIQRYLSERYVRPTEASWTIYQANGQGERFYRYWFRIVQQPPEKPSL